MSGIAVFLYRSDRSIERIDSLSYILDEFRSSREAPFMFSTSPIAAITSRTNRIAAEYGLAEGFRSKAVAATRHRRPGPPARPGSFRRGTSGCAWAWGALRSAGVDDIHVGRLEVLEAERDPPIADLHGPSAPPVAPDGCSRYPGASTLRGDREISRSVGTRRMPRTCAGFSRRASSRSQGLGKPAWMVVVETAAHGSVKRSG